MFGQAGFGDPFDGGAIERLRLARQQGAAEEFQVDRLLGIRVGNLGEQVAHGNRDPKFLADFPNQTLLWGLPRLALAARELPITAQMRLRVPTG